MKLYLWDQAATDFCEKFNSCENTPTVLLVTTVNTKRLGGNYLALWTHILSDNYDMFYKKFLDVPLSDQPLIKASLNIFFFVIGC